MLENMGKETEPKEISFEDQLTLRILWEQTLINGYPPSLRDIANEFQIAKSELEKIEIFLNKKSQSTNVVRSSLKRLEEAGYLKMSREKTRGIKLIKDSILPPILRSSDQA